MTTILCARCVIAFGLGSDDYPRDALTIHNGEGLCAAHLADTVETPVTGFRDRLRGRFSKRLAGMRTKAS